MKLYLEKYNGAYYLHTKEVEWNEVWGNWKSGLDHDIGAQMCPSQAESVFPEAEEMVDGDLLELNIEIGDVWVADV